MSKKWYFRILEMIFFIEKPSYNIEFVGEDAR